MYFCHATAQQNENCSTNQYWGKGTAQSFSGERLKENWSHGIGCSEFPCILADRKALAESVSAAEREKSCKQFSCKLFLFLKNSSDCAIAERNFESMHILCVEWHFSTSFCCGAIPPWHGGTEDFAGLDLSHPLRTQQFAPSGAMIRHRASTPIKSRVASRVVQSSLMDSLLRYRRTV